MTGMRFMPKGYGGERRDPDRVKLYGPRPSDREARHG